MAKKVKSKSFWVGRTRNSYEVGSMKKYWNRRKFLLVGFIFGFCWEDFENATDIKLKVGECKRFKLVEVK